MKLLIVHEAPTVSYVKALVRQGFLVGEMSDIAEAGLHCSIYFYDVVIVDTDSPGVQSVELMKNLKSGSPRTGIIIVSDPVPVQQKIELLLTGADDYLVRPIEEPELSARIRSLIRRCALGGEKELSFHEVKLTPASRRVSCCGNTVKLTRKEYELLFYFLRNPEKVLTHEMIAEYLWGDFKSLSADCFDFIYCHVKNIRKKLTGAGAKPLIDTVYGVGYIMK